MQVPKILFVALVSHAFLKSVWGTPAVGTVLVYTELAAWEAKVNELSTTAIPQCVSDDDFSGNDIPLTVGSTDVGLFNASIDSLDGVTTALGQIGGEFVGWINANGPTIFDLHNFDNSPIIGFAGNWNSTTSSNKLTITINGQTINFTDSFPVAGTGGFLGFIDPNGIVGDLVFGTENALTNEGEYFTIDDVKAAGRCPDCNTVGCNGDPHFKTWRGQHFDYHGECDLVLLHSSAFESGLGLGLDVHIRTKIRRGFSFISSAALRIGKDLLEVESQGVYWLNGVLSADLPNEFSGFAFSHTQPTDKQHVFDVHLGGRERIKVKTYKDFVSVLIEQASGKHFGDSVGLMGDFRMGHMIARDGKTVLDDANAFGQEWQVRDTEPSLFHTVRLPQHPQQVCTLPTPKQASQLRRRLEESSSVSQLAAEKACEHWGEGKDDCVFDVLTTGDLEMAVVGAY
jgi:hypothetical protein